MSDQQFHIDDEVQLKSGGPFLIVKGYSTSGRVKCTWLDGEGHWREEDFVEATLQLFKKGRNQ